MATDVNRGYFGWSQELSDADEHQEISISRALDHGSISFGRFASESLSWERRSVFTHDSRQEELEKFNGLVAQKKAYFEERYRKMRTLKTLQQQGQQTELILDYGRDSGNSSQSGEEEDENIQEHESFSGEKEDKNITTLDEDKVEPVFDHKLSCNEAVQSKEFDSEPTLPDANSSVGSFDMHLQVSEMELPPMTGNMEEKELNYGATIDSKEVVSKQEILGSRYKHGVTRRGSVLDIKSLNDNRLQYKKPQADKSVPRVKEDSVSGDRNARAMKRETKMDTLRTSRVAMYATQKMVNKAESSQPPRKTTINRVDNNTKSTAAASNRPLRMTRSNVNTQASNALAVEKRASNRGISASTDARIPKKSPVSENGGLRVQDSLEAKVLTREVNKIIGPENKRVSKEALKRPSSSGHPGSMKEPNPLNYLALHRSQGLFTLSAKMKPHCISGTETQFTTNIGTKQEKGRENIRFRDSQGVIKRTNAPSTPHARTIPKPPQFPSAEIVRTANKQRFNNLSLSENKTRQEAPKWR